ncbi:hypothetical protein KDW67_27450 [Burkholderia cenocepacia]|uniref:hypothetical protein n=1 Tax=Burkholderia cenocepacia TaxID=95486 RepID=UPI00097CBFBA|nr:hypothetical protein [Burkholderia cenocepacia]AQQ45138.1 hypothetical protein A8F32_01450 [Burkholderia cenocepacia]MBJ9914767.1 hypothetical protein [Burkholderia cenocepacia]MBR8118271.1 hypothetical protein [Burkholderia cenocepacia]MBR8263722.1 hypothetical protein [Burkholderia cenocepacia]MCW3584492.1 hypothetical protein [Burkholderia cenocepacia]
MATASNARQTSDAGSTDEGRRSGQRTVTPTRTRKRPQAAGPRDDARRVGRGDGRASGNGPVTPSRGEEAGKPLWEDDRGEMPPEEWS